MILTNDIDALLREADHEARATDVRLTGEEVFGRLRDRYDSGKV